MEEAFHLHVSRLALTRPWRDYNILTFDFEVHKSHHPELKASVIKYQRKTFTREPVLPHAGELSIISRIW